MAPRTEIARQISLSHYDVGLFASLGRLDDYLELELPREAYSSGLLEGLEGLPTELAGDRLDWRAREGDPSILSFMLIRSDSHQPADPAPLRLGRLLGEIAQQAPRFDFGDLAPAPPTVLPTPSPQPAMPVAQTASQVADPRASTGSATPAPATESHPGIASHDSAWLMDRSSVALAMEHARRGQTHQSLRILDEVLSRTPGHLEAHQLRDSLKLMERREKRRRREPSNPQAHMEAGFSYLSLNREPEALDALRRAARLDPRCYLSHLLLGIAYHRVGAAAQARSAYRSAQLLHRDDVLFSDLQSALERGDPPPVLAESHPGPRRATSRAVAL